MSGPDFLYDDAYITLQSAATLWSGHDPHYQGATSLDGITSPFHLLIVATLARLLPPEWALLASCMLGTAAYVAGLAALGRLEGLSNMVTAAVVLIGVGTGVATQHQINGLETSWTMAAVCWSLVLVRRDRPVALAALCGVVPFVRPELAIWSVALLGWSGCKHPARVTVFLLVAALTAAPWALWVWSATGSVVQTSLAAKRDWYAESCWPLEQRLSVVGRGLAVWAAFSAGALAGLFGLLRTGVGRMALGAMLAIIVVWSMNVPSVLYSYHHHRYFAPMLVLLAFGVCHLPARVRQPLALAGAVAAIVTSVAYMRLEPGMIAAIGKSRSGVVEQLASMRAKRVMLHDAGYLAWADAAPTLIDMVGLKSPEAAALHARLTAPSCGTMRAAALAELARQTRPDVLVVWEPWDQLYGVTAALREAGWSPSAPILIGTTAPIAVYSLEPPSNVSSSGSSLPH